VDRTDFCNRVGCGKAAEAVLLMVPQSRRAWIVEPSHDKAPDGSPLCEIHVSRTTVPVGWVLTDDRSSPRKRKKKSKKVSKKQSVPAQIIEDAYPEPDLNMEIPIEDVPIVKDEIIIESKDEDQRTGMLEELTSEPFEESFLQVVPNDGVTEEITQGSLWDDGLEGEQIQPGQETPLLKRAFRLVNDE
jgi:hypothetical protein